jgi:hypothetical protein
MIKVYVDTSGEMKDLRRLRQEGLATSVHFHYDKRLNRIDEVAPPSNLQWDGSHATWTDVSGLSWADFKKKPMHDAIGKIIGAGKKKDVQHLASAHAAGCHALITGDKDDMWNHRVALYELLGIRVFHSSTEWDQFVAFCNSHAD